MVEQWGLNPYLDTGVVNPGLDVWYDILPPRSDVKINYMTLGPTAAGDNWEAQAILDGVTYATPGFCPAGLHYIHLDADEAHLDWNANQTPFGTDEFIEFKTAQVQFRRRAAVFALTAQGRGRVQTL